MGLVLRQHFRNGAGEVCGREKVKDRRRPGYGYAPVRVLRSPMSHGKPTESNLKTVPLVAITPEKKEEPVTEAIQVLPLHTPEQVAAAPPQA